MEKGMKPSRIAVKPATARSQSHLLWPLRALLVAAVVLPLAFFATSAWLSYQSTFQNAENRAQHLTRLLREHTAKVFETIRLVLQQTDQRLQNVDVNTMRAARETWVDIKALQGSVEQVGAIFIIDKDGSVALTTRAFPTPEASFADRDYFLEQQSADRGLYLGRQYVGKISEAPIFNFSIRRTSPDGDFNGVVGVSALHTYFEEFYATVGMPADNFAISLIRDDGNFLVRYPAARTEVMPENNLLAHLHGSREGNF